MTWRGEIMALPEFERLPAALDLIGDLLGGGSADRAHWRAMLGLPPARVQKHVDAGAPAGADGTINLVHYAAWLNWKLACPESAGGELAEPVEGARTGPIAASVSAPLRRDRKPEAKIGLVTAKPEAKTDGN